MIDCKAIEIRLAEVNHPDGKSISDCEGFVVSTLLYARGGSDHLILTVNSVILIRNELLG